MRSGTLVALVSAVVLASPTATPAATQAPFMTVGGLTSQPIGHYEFCQTHEAECHVTTARETRVRLTADLWSQLVGINATVNRKVAPATDMEVFGREEVWAYPASEGDCEDVALEKRRELVARGWPIGALLMTVVRRDNGEGHAVLTVLTDRGDLVLDNLQSGIRVWSDTPYRFVKRQSALDSGQWAAIEDLRMTSVGSSSP
jgi:predicted transglutaminase-like cysteine proteinase